MKTLFLAWQANRPNGGAAHASRLWFPIGRLDVDAEQRLYRFAYTQGALKAQREAGFEALEAFPDLRQDYESSELFSLFQNRLLSHRRGDYVQFLERLALDPESADPLDVLALSEGRRQTDNLEVFPRIAPRRDGSFSCRFFLHGWRHVSEAAQARVATLREGDVLRVALELNNPVTGAAVQLQSADDYFMLGWTPRYLVNDILAAASRAAEEIQARVVRVNPEPAPHNQRVLVELHGRFPTEFQPMAGPDFQPFVAAPALAH